MYIDIRIFIIVWKFKLQSNYAVNFLFGFCIYVLCNMRCDNLIVALQTNFFSMNSFQND